LSQAGMVAHWRRTKGRHYLSMFLNGLGAFVTAITVLVVMVAKFVEGAWITLAMIPLLFWLMKAVHRQYQWMEKEVALDKPLDLAHLRKPIVVVPVDEWSKITQKALRFALDISPDVLGLHIQAEGELPYLCKHWHELVEEPAERAGFSPPKLTIVKSPYRYVLNPILEFVNAQAKKNPDRHIVVIIPEKILNRWYHYLLHNRRGTLLKAMLYFAGNPQIVVTNVPWYLGAQYQQADTPRPNKSKT
jgi:Ca2+/Na+ antiporter